MGVAISVALVVFLFRSVDRHELGAVLARARWEWVLLSAGLAPAALWARAHRWRYLFPPAAAPRGLLAATMIGYMANNVLPLRAGELVRVYVVARRRGGGFWMILATLVVERVLDSLVIVSILGSLVLLLPVPVVFRSTAIVLLAFDAVATAIFVALAAAPGPFRTLVARLLRRWPALERRAQAALAMFAQGLGGIRTLRHAVPLTVWTVVVWAFSAAAAWTMLRAFNLELPWLAGWTVLAFVGLGVSLPSAPGYIGVFHYAAALAVGLFGVPTSAAAAFAIVFHVGQTVPVTLIGWLYLLREHVSLGEAARVSVAP